MPGAEPPRQRSLMAASARHPRPSTGPAAGTADRIDRPHPAATASGPLAPPQLATSEIAAAREAAAALAVFERMGTHVKAEAAGESLAELHAKA